MYTRVVETISKQGRARELCHAIDEKVLPILRKQAGFVDEVVMVSDTEANHVIAVSFWKTRQDAERYEREQFDKFLAGRREKAASLSTEERDRLFQEFLQWTKARERR